MPLELLGHFPNIGGGGINLVVVVARPCVLQYRHWTTYFVVAITFSPLSFCMISVNIIISIKIIVNSYKSN